MNATDLKVDVKIGSLREQVSAAQQEFDIAIKLHETWKPAAYDQDLHERMGDSFASQTFLVVRMALRREMLLALMRLWDRDSRAVMKESITDVLRDQSVVHALAAGRAANIGIDQVRHDLSQRAIKAIALVDKYSKGGSHYAVPEKLRRLRHERLAHRQIEGMPVTAADEEIESFYQDNLELIRLLQYLVEGIAYDPDGAAETFHLYAKSFWAGVRGERTEGHPDYRAPPTGLEDAERR